MSLTGFLWLAGFALFFVGERLYGGGDEVWRWVLDGAGLALALGGLGLLLSRQGRMSEDQRGPFRLALIYALVGYGVFMSLFAYFYTFNFVLLLSYTWFLGFFVLRGGIFVDRRRLG